MVWVRPRGPRPGLAHSSPALPNSAVCTVEELGWGKRPGQDNRGGSRLKKRKSGGGGGGGQGADPGPKQGQVLGCEGEGPDSGWAVPRGAQRKSVVTLRTGGTVASHRGS